MRIKLYDISFSSLVMEEIAQALSLPAEAIQPMIRFCSENALAMVIFTINQNGQKQEISWRRFNYSRRQTVKQKVGEHSILLADLKKEVDGTKFWKILQRPEYINPAPAEKVEGIVAATQIVFDHRYEHAMRPEKGPAVGEAKKLFS